MGGYYDPPYSDEGRVTKKSCFLICFRFLLLFFYFMYERGVIMSQETLDLINSIVDIIVAVGRAILILWFGYYIYTSLKYLKQMINIQNTKIEQLQQQIAYLVQKQQNNNNNF